MPRPSPAPLLLLTLALLAGCEKKLTIAPHENQRPVVSFSRAPSRAGDLYTYTYEMRWAGFDPDGEVQSFRYAVDPPVPTAAVPAPDTAWVSTTDFGGTFEFHAAVPQPQTPGTNALAADYHVFVVEAVDNRGLTSLPATVAFNASTIVPVARILTPVPSSRFRQYLPPSFTITWEGSDLDGVASKKPIYYRTKILSGSTPITPTLMSTYPDTLIHFYQPRGWATWDSLGPDVNSVTLSELPPLQDFVFVVIAFDEAGAYTPYASGDVNALSFRALYASVGGPVITIFNDFFSYTYSSGVYAPNDRKTWIELEVPAKIPLNFGWFAKAQEGTTIRSYRWVLDSENLNDDTPRSNELTDTSHWSVPASTAVSATVGPYVAAGEHRLYVEATDGNNLKSLAIVHFTVVTGTFEKSLAICDDTRYKLDTRSAGASSCIDQPRGPFPTAAELDTFLYARGGFPIKCYPAGSVSRPGLFKGYDYDTLNMRTGHLDQTPSLATLGRYRHLIWLVDNGAVVKTRDGTNLVDGMTTMAYMNSSGNLNALAAYIRMGGEVWLAGGGAMGASVLSNKAVTLQPGRFIYDLAGWRSELRASSGVFTVRRSLGRFEGTGAYSQFPDALAPKSLAAGDTLPAWRTSNGEFFVSTWNLESLDLPARVTEAIDSVTSVSTLDTLYSVTGGLLPPNSTIMTVYHGSKTPRVIATGFDLWTWNRTRLIQVVDGVLQGLWGMVRSGPPPAATSSRRSRTTAPTGGASATRAVARPPAHDSR